MSIKLALALFNLVTAVIRAMEQQRWYQQGKAAADAERDAIETERIRLANAARADADALNAGDGLSDDDGFQRPG